MVVISKNTFGLELTIEALVYTFDTFLLYSAFDGEKRRFMVSSAFVGSDGHRLQELYIEQNTASCLLQKTVFLPGGPRSCAVFSVESDSPAQHYEITKALEALRSYVGMKCREVSCRMVPAPTEPFPADLLWNRFDIRYPTEAEWCEITCGDRKFVVGVHNEGDQIRIGILFLPLGPNAVRALLVFLFETFPSANTISYQTIGFSISEIWKAVLERESVCFVLDLDPALLPVEQRTNRKTRYNLYRSKRLLEKELGPVTINTYPAAECPDDVIERYISLKALRYHLSPEERDPSALFSGTKLSADHVYVLQSGSVILSVLLCAEQCNTASLVNLAFDPAYAKYSPGVLLYLEVLRELEMKRKEFVYLGSGSYAYKRLFHSLECNYYVGDVQRDVP